MKKIIAILVLLIGLQANAVLEFGSRDTIVNKGVGGTGNPQEFIALYDKIIILTNSNFKGTLDKVTLSARATSANGGILANGVPQISAKVYTSIDGTETFETIPLMVWDNGETSVSKYTTVVDPINKRIVTTSNGIVSVEFVDDDNGNGFTDFAGVAQIGFTNE